MYLNALEIVENDFVDASIEKEIVKQVNQKQTETKKEATIKDVINYIEKHNEKNKELIDKFLADNTLIELNELDLIQAKELATIIKTKRR